MKARSIGSSEYDTVLSGTWNGSTFTADEKRLLLETHWSKWAPDDFRRYVELVQLELAIEARQVKRV